MNAQTERKWCLMVAVTVLLLMFGSGALAQNAPVASPPAPGAAQVVAPTGEAGGYTRADVLPYMQNTPAPNFTLSTMDGGQVSLAEYRGKYVMLHFWATWSRESLQDMRLCQQVSRMYEDVVVLSVNSLPIEFGRSQITLNDRTEMENWTRSFVTENGYTFPVLLDVDGKTSAVYTGKIPVTYFIDRDGVLRIPWEGPLSQQTVQTLLDMLFALDQ